MARVTISEAGIKPGSHDWVRHNAPPLHHHDRAPIAVWCEQHGGPKSPLPGFSLVEEAPGYRLK